MELIPYVKDLMRIPLEQILCQNFCFSDMENWDKCDFFVFKLGKHIYISINF